MEPNPEKPLRRQQGHILELMGLFWLFFGLIVLLATFFVEENQYVPRTRGQLANLLGGALLVLVGLGVYLHGRIVRRRS